MRRKLPVNVPVYVRYTGNENDELSTGNRSCHIVVPDNLDKEDWNDNTIKSHNMEGDLLVGYSDGKIFHILNKTKKGCGIPLAVVRDEYKTFVGPKDMFRGALTSFMKVYNTIKNSNAKFTIDWNEEERNIEAKTIETFDDHRRHANIPSWNANDYKRYPTFVWEVNTLPFSKVSFEKEAIASEPRDRPYFNYLFSLKCNKIN